MFNFTKKAIYIQYFMQNKISIFYYIKIIITDIFFSSFIQKGGDKKLCTNSSILNINKIITTDPKKHFMIYIMH